MIPELHRWSTGSAPPGRAFKHWTEHARARIGDLSFRCGEEEDDFQAQFVQRQIGPIGLTAIRVGRTEAYRQDSARRKAPVRYDLKYVRRGAFKLSQSGQTIDAMAGDFVLVDNDRDFALETSRNLECICLTLPDDWLRGHLPDPEACTVLPIGNASTWARALGMMMGELADLPSGDSQLPAPVIAEQVAGFLTLMFGGQASGTSTYRRQLIRDIIRSIRGYHHDPDLSPAHVAVIHRISKRYIHSLLASAGTTFGRELLRARLEHAREMLISQGFAQATVSEIAMLCGFTDPAHFSRRFREAYNRVPSDFRKAIR